MSKKEHREYFNRLVEACAVIDRMPKNERPAATGHDAYTSMCIDIAQGYEPGIIHSGMYDLIFNEFGEMELYDDFLERHPNFSEDISKAMQKLRE